MKRIKIMIVGNADAREELAHALSEYLYKVYDVSLIYIGSKLDKDEYSIPDITSWHETIDDIIRHAICRMCYNSTLKFDRTWYIDSVPFED